MGGGFCCFWCCYFRCCCCCCWCGLQLRLLRLRRRAWGFLGRGGYDTTGVGSCQTPARPQTQHNPPAPNPRAGYSGKRFVFEKANELGVKAVVLDAPDSWAQLMEGEGVISKFVPIDFSDAENVFDHCLEVGLGGAGFWGF